jgi:LysR family transcriptional regulator, mexEF-oprN operon transcriptional activator
VVKLIEMNHSFNEIDFRGLDLNVLLAFTALMRERSVTKAAQRLLLGPSAMSMALKRLRELFDDPLLVRTRNGMEPTPRALALYERVEQALGEVHAAAFEPAVFDPKKLKRSFRFGAPDDLELALVPALLQRLSIEAPGVRLVIWPSDFRHALDALDSGDIDLALTAMPERLESWHRAQMLHREHFVCLYDPKQVAVKKAMSLVQYLSLPHLLLSPRGDTSGPIDEQLRALGQSRQVLASVAHFPLMPFLLRATPSVVNMPATAARFYAQEFSLQIRELPITSPQFDMALLWHARLENDRGLTWFASLVQELVASLHTPGEPVASLKPKKRLKAQGATSTKLVLRRSRK